MKTLINKEFPAGGGGFSRQNRLLYWVLAHTPHSKAFTLAEVLITLGIIGVVCALTLPGIIQKNQERIWLNQFKATYSILSQAYLRTYQEHGLPETWGLPENRTKEGTALVASYLFPHLKASRDFGQNDKHSTYGLPIKYTGLNGKQIATGFNGWNGIDYIYGLANGAVIGIQGFVNDQPDKKFRITLYLDINGAKGPNQFGKDFFIICLSSRKNYPIVTGYDLWWLSKNSCSTTAITSSWYSGGGCAVWIITTGNMDYLHREITQEEWDNMPLGNKVPK